MPQPDSKPAFSLAFSRILRPLLVAIAAVFFVLHFPHLNADFPNNSPWVDWSKYTDEGWYGDAAIRQVLFGHWYFKGDFNPAVALPTWPALELIAFRLFGVSAAVARAFTLCIFFVTLAASWFLLEEHTRARTDRSGLPLAAAFALLLLCTSPFLYVFERMAILEPLLVCLTLLAMLAASRLRSFPPSTKPSEDRFEPDRYAVRTVTTTGTSHGRGPVSLLRRQRFASVLWSTALGLLLPAMVLTKTTAVFLVPAIAYLVYARAGYRLRPALRLAVPPAVLAFVLYVAYYGLFVRRYLEDYRYLFSANAYTGIELERFDRVILHTVADGIWMGGILYPLFFVVLALLLFWKPRLFTNPLVPALLLWTAGYFLFLAYHNNLQPRYYLVVAVPITLLVALGLDSFREAQGARATMIGGSVVGAALLAVVVPDALQTLDYVRHPTYTFRSAAEGIAQIVRADKDHSNLILSISGSDITLMTGLPSIDDDFGTLELPDRVKAYRPGWYAAWNELDDDKMDALTPIYHPMRVASFPAMDDSDRNLLILYRLDPAGASIPLKHTRPLTPKPLRTKLGQQPTTQQLEH